MIWHITGSDACATDTSCESLHCTSPILEWMFMCCDLSIILGFVTMLVTVMVPLGKDTATEVKQMEIEVV